MNIKTANLVSHMLNASGLFEAKRVSTGTSRDYALTVHEKTRKNSGINSAVLSRYNYIEAISKVFECGMLIQAGGNYPYYHLY